MNIRFFQCVIHFISVLHAVDRIRGKLRSHDHSSIFPFINFDVLSYFDRFIFLNFLSFFDVFVNYLCSCKICGVCCYNSNGRCFCCCDIDDRDFCCHIDNRNFCCCDNIARIFRSCVCRFYTR